ncbi:hypothetical protein ACEWY4_017295 [Coilia grayii]|uniref:Ig-like domain-containing protein n=1 Tax=Coilia grayii TaxID=363190 RepID=A0ABD1JHM0_9TELE
MSCSYTHPSDLTVTQAYWTKQGYGNQPDLTTNPDYKGRINAGCQQENSRCSLQVCSLNKADSGAYYCRVTVSAQGQIWTRTAAVYLEVGEAPQTPSLSIYPPGNIQEGTDVTLTCTSRSHLPVRSYSWYKTQGSAATTRLDHRGDINPTHYKIKHISREGGGGYYCQTSYTCGNRNSSTVNLQVSCE